MLWTLLQAATATPTGHDGALIPPVPDPLNWAFGVAGLIALTLAALALPAVFWGAPVIEIDFITDGPCEDHGGALRCSVRNKPPSKHLRRLVRRESAAVAAHLRIHEEYARNEVVNTLPEFALLDGSHTRHPLLSPSLVSRPTFIVALRNKQGAVVSEHDGSTVTRLPDGAYFADVLIEFGGEVFSETRRFVVAADTLYWAAADHSRKAIIVTREV